MSQASPSHLEGNIETCFVFMIPLESGLFLPDRESTLPPFRDPAGPLVLTLLAEGLQRRSLKVTRPRPGKGCDAFSRISSSNFTLSLVLNVIRHQGCIQFALLTYPRRSLWRGSLTPSDIERWDMLCSEIESTLLADPRISKPLRLSRSDAELRWASGKETR